MLSNNTEDRTQRLEKLITDLLNDIKDVNSILIIMARQHDGEALFRIGKLYYAKQTKEDYLKAFEWFRLAYDENYADAICQIGQMYRYGKGVLVNHDIAMQFYMKAAGLGNSDAKFQIGCLYHYGIGRPSSYNEAFQWYSKAAHQNNGDAQNNLGYLYEKGQGVHAHLGFAMYWYEKGASAGNDRARVKVEEYKKLGIKAEQPFTQKSLDQNQAEVLKHIKALMLNDTQEQVFTKKLESLIMERKFRLF